MASPLIANEAVAVRHSQVTEVQRLGGLLAASGYFSDAKEMAQAAVKVMAGEELGIPPVAAMMGINIIKGKIALSGNLIASRIRAHGYDYRHKQFDTKGCVLEFLSKADATGKRTLLGIASFNEEDAKTAQVFSDMYKKYPRNMYFNRAISNGAKWYTPEVFAGAPVYVAEELGVSVDENGDMVHGEPAPIQPAAERKVTEMKVVLDPEPALPEQELSQLDQVLLTFTKAAVIADAFDRLQTEFCKVLDESVWSQILEQYGIDPKTKTFGTIGNAKKGFRSCWNALEKEMAMMQEQPQ